MAKKGASRRKNSARREHRGIGILFWICLAAIMIAVGVAARAPISSALARVFGAPNAATAPKEPPAVPSRSVPQVTVNPLPSPSAETPVGRTQSPAGTPVRTQVIQPVAVSPGPAAATTKPAYRKTRLFFVTVEDSGTITMKGVIRSIPASDSPLRDTLEALLKGPTSQELNLGLLSMVPSESRLRSVTMRGEVAYLDFSESFRFNAQGTEALDAQLRQIVYAATEYPTVKKVQVLIEGKVVRSLGAESVRVDAPLSRSSFQG
jgi:germination protein M